MDATCPTAWGTGGIKVPGDQSLPFRDGRVVESRMFFYDTAAVLDFLIRAESSRLA